MEYTTKNYYSRPSQDEKLQSSIERKRERSGLQLIEPMASSEKNRHSNQQLFSFIMWKFVELFAFSRSRNLCLFTIQQIESAWHVDFTKREVEAVC